MVCGPKEGWPNSERSYSVFVSEKLPFGIYYSKVFNLIVQLSLSLWLLKLLR